MKKKTLKKNPSNRKPISYSTQFRLDIKLNKFVRKFYPAMINAFQDTFCYTFGEGSYRHTGIQTDIQTDIQTYRPSDEVGCRGAFAPKKLMRFLTLTTNIKYVL